MFGLVFGASQTVTKISRNVFPLLDAVSLMNVCCGMGYIALYSMIDYVSIYVGKLDLLHFSLKIVPMFSEMNALLAYNICIKVITVTKQLYGL